MPAARIRAVLPCAVSIALGALTTAAIAWACAAWPVPNFRGIKRSISFDRDRDAAAGEGRGYLSLRGVHEFGTLSLFSVASQQGINGMYYNYNPNSAEPNLSQPLRRAVQPWVTGAAPWPPDGVEDRRHVSASGWPWLALYAVSGDRSDSTGPTPYTGLHMPLWFYGNSMTEGPRLYYLPTTPIPFGFIADTFLFAIPWNLALFAPGTVRRWRRRRRGRCIRCAYDLRATPPEQPCPECGRRASHVARAGPGSANLIGHALDFIAMQPDPDILVDLTSASSPATAEILALALRDAGIPTHVTANAGAMNPLEIGSMQPYRVSVLRRDLARAREVLKEAAGDEVDWDQVDVGEPEQGVSMAPPTSAPRRVGSGAWMRRAGLLVFCVGAFAAFGAYAIIALLAAALIESAAIYRASKPDHGADA